jgi:hypothetical protein
MKGKPVARNYGQGMLYIDQAPNIPAIRFAVGNILAPQMLVAALYINTAKYNRRLCHIRLIV